MIKRYFCAAKHCKQKLSVSAVAFEKFAIYAIFTGAVALEVSGMCRSTLNVLNAELGQSSTIKKSLRLSQSGLSYTLPKQV
ncbi:MAG: hypothetical protein OFPI_15940 [Osedax symbiont Rs2]|nr:MAG: hypothetical protein OFPI_15940 [Osedax symbiont Rs2]